MNDDAGGWLWLLIDVGMVVILAGALIYGVMMWRRQRERETPEEHARREEATKALYRTEDRR